MTQKTSCKGDGHTDTVSVDAIMYHMPMLQKNSSYMHAQEDELHNPAQDFIQHSSNSI